MTRSRSGEFRLRHYTQRTERGFIARLENTKLTTWEELNEAWFEYSNPNPAHYNSMRYHAITLNNVWRTGTVEVRAFNGTNHAGNQTIRRADPRITFYMIGIAIISKVA